MAKKVIYISPEIMEAMCHRLAVTFFAQYKEPIPFFKDHSRAMLESSINLPRATFGRKELYPTLSQKAAVLFYSMIKNHPFKNGNKRIATATLLVFLYLNKYWILDTNHNFYKLAIEVASSRSKDRYKILHKIELWLRNHITSVKRLRKRDIPLWLVDRSLFALVRWIRGFWEEKKDERKKEKKHNKEKK